MLLLLRFPKQQVEHAKPPSCVFGLSCYSLNRRPYLLAQPKQKLNAFVKPLLTLRYKTVSFKRAPCVQTSPCTASLANRRFASEAEQASEAVQGATSAQLSVAYKPPAYKSFALVCLQNRRFCVHSFANFSKAKVRKPNVVR